MHEPDWAGPLDEAHSRALAYLAGLPNRQVGAAASLAELRAALGGPLPEHPTDAREVIAALASSADPGTVASGSGRYFGFVVGGTTPAALAADWLTATWDQNAGLYAIGPAAAVAEEVAGAWLAELLGLPADASVGFVTGAQMANVTGLAAGRHEVLSRTGWDVEAAGLNGAPRLRVLVGAERHATVDRAVRFLGMGSDTMVPVEADAQGRVRPAALAEALAQGSGPAIVCAQIGNVNTGAIDPVGEICQIAHEAGAWVHVDGAFGLWAAASPRLKLLLAGIELADSWAADAHKWLNVPYDSGLAFCAHPEAHRAAMGIRASYLVHGSSGERDPMDYTPESSRRARGIPVYAALRCLGRQGAADLVDRCCAMARRFADQLGEQDRFEVLNEVVLNQVLVRIRAANDDGDGNGESDSDEHTREVIRRVQADGTCWLGGTTWHGQAAMRISVSNWSTDESDVDRSVEAILRCAAQADAARSTELTAPGAG